MKTSTGTAESMESALRARAVIADAISNLQRTLQTQTELRDKLETEGDITRPETLDQIVRARTFVELLPRRIVHREGLFIKATNETVAQLNRFISETLSPKLTRLSAAARQKARESLAPHFPDPTQLESAVEMSVLVRELGNLHSEASIREPAADQVDAYAQQIKAIAARVEALEKKLF